MLLRGHLLLDQRFVQEELQSVVTKTVFDPMTQTLVTESQLTEILVS
jgi:hypothetical protein